MIRRRGQGPQEEDSSSSDEEDAFSALSNKRGAKRSKLSTEPSHSTAPAQSVVSSVEQPKEPTKSNDSANKMILPTSVTSSMKRHHKTNDKRKAKMDALLEELAAEQIHRPIDKKPRSQRFVPEKKGSYVDPSEEHLTTNMFVGNLDPTLTEHEVRSLFSKFDHVAKKRGRAESKSSNWYVHKAVRCLIEAIIVAQLFAITMMTQGFVCYMNREDAEAAMEECNDADPFNVGRLLMLRWGKNLKTSDRSGNKTSTEIRVDLPVGSERFHFISRVAKFVAENGSKAERRLKDKEFANPAFRFLTFNAASNPEQKREHLFYRWRVYSFAQGDSYSEWRTKPFQMFEPHGRTWIPPPIHNKESDASRQKEDKDGSNDEAFTTGRQIERARGGRRKGDRARALEGRATLTKSELERFDTLVRKQLTVSRHAICEAMAFCFEKSASAREIAEILRNCLVDEAPILSIDAKIARLYLLSDILFNSQQPGVRNAFMYRDAIEKMAADVFTSLGRNNSRDGSIGRMTMNKLRMAVKSVLGAWTEWSVYNPTFMDELEARFEGKEIKEEVVEAAQKDDEPEVEELPKAEPVEVITTAPQGGWTMLSEDVKRKAAKAKKKKKSKKNEETSKKPMDSENNESSENNDEKTDGGNRSNSPAEMDGSPVDQDDLNGEPMDDESDEGEVFEDGDNDDGNRSETTEYDELDGAPLADSDLDEPLEFFPGFDYSDEAPSGTIEKAIENKEDRLGEEIDREVIDGKILEDEDNADTTG